MKPLGDKNWRDIIDKVLTRTNLRNCPNMMIIGGGNDTTIAAATEKVLKVGYITDRYYLGKWAGVDSENGARYSTRTTVVEKPPAIIILKPNRQLTVTIVIILQ